MSAMCPESVKRHSGFSLVTAIFLLVILASLGAFIVTISGVQQTSSALDVLGTRAYQAARSGIEWGVYQAVHGSCAGSTNLTPGGTLSGFTVTVTCNNTSHNEAGVTVQVYQLTSTASQGAVGTIDRVERELEATVAL